MSIRRDVATPALNDANARLKKILELGMAAMSIKSPLDNMEQNQINTAARNMDSIHTMGLNLASAVLPTGPNLITRERTKVVEDRLLTDLATYRLRRPNNRSPGVVWSDEVGNEATVLFISNNSEYDDSYLNYLEALIAKRANTPDVVYDYPKTPNRGMFDERNTESYQKQAAAHLNKLKEKSRTDPASGNFSNAYDQPHTKIYLFYKIPVTGEAQALPYGPYLYFGRFQAVYDNNNNRIRLQKFVVPQQDQANEIRVVSLRDLAPTVDLGKVTGSDVNTVYSNLSKASARASSSYSSHRPVPRAPQPPQPPQPPRPPQPPQPPPPRPPPPLVTPPNPVPSARPQAITPTDNDKPRPYRIRRRSLNIDPQAPQTPQAPPAQRVRRNPETDDDSDLEEGEIRE